MAISSAISNPGALGALGALGTLGALGNPRTAAPVSAAPAKQPEMPLGYYGLTPRGTDSAVDWKTAGYQMQPTHTWYAGDVPRNVSTSLHDLWDVQGRMGVARTPYTGGGYNRDDTVQAGLLRQAETMNQYGPDHPIWRQLAAGTAPAAFANNPYLKPPVGAAGYTAPAGSSRRSGGAGSGQNMQDIRDMLRQRHAGMAPRTTVTPMPTNWWSGLQGGSGMWGGGALGALGGMGLSPSTGGLFNGQTIQALMSRLNPQPAHNVTTMPINASAGGATQNRSQGALGTLQR